VDDERTIADTLKIILQRAGFEVAVAYGGEESVTTAHSFRPDIVLADYYMPNVNGIEACIEIKRLLPACRIMMLSGHSLAEEIDRLPKGYDFLLISKPIPPDKLLQALTAESIEQSDTSRRFHILNVDDVEVHRYSMSRLFTRAGFEVSEAATGSDALRLAMERKPDLILLDIHLPDRDGYDVCATLKGNPETARITIMHVTSSAIDSESAARSKLAGADDYIPYPVSPRTLVQRSRDLLQLRLLKEFAS
jgi:CheY-like chemotaxis protein